jgi:hypothetical protein
MDFLRWCRNQWERSIALAVVVFGLVAFFLGWLGQRDKGLVTEQIPYVVSGAMFGMLLIVIGATVWLSADLHDEWVKLDRVEDALVDAISLLRERPSGLDARELFMGDQSMPLDAETDREAVSRSRVPAVAAELNR